MGYLTKYGSAWGAIPQTGGSVLWVAPSAAYTVDGKAYSASDDNDGLSPERAKLTLAAAMTVATANAGDVICLLPGTHAWSASVAWSKAGLTVIGLPYYPEQQGARVGRPRPHTTISTSASDEILNITAADSTLINVRILPTTQKAGVDFTTAADRLTIRHCYVDLRTATAHASTQGIIATGATQAPRNVAIEGCWFEEGNGGTSNGVGLELAASLSFLVSDCVFYKDGTVASSAAWAVAMQMQDNCAGLVRDCDMVALVGGAGGAITKGMNGVTHTGASAVCFLRNFFSVNVTKPFDDWAAADVDIGNNYVATVAGGTGGTLVTATT